MCWDILITLHSNGKDQKDAILVRWFRSSCLLRLNKRRQWTKKQKNTRFDDKPNQNWQDRDRRYKLLWVGTIKKENESKKVQV